MGVGGDAMNIFRYIDKYGVYTFEEVPFGEVDNAIFAALSYVDLEGLVSKNRFNKRTIKEVGDDYFKLKYSKKDKKNILAVRQAIKMLRYIKDTRRFGGLYLYNYAYEAGEEEQFSAITIEIHSKLVYVSFEGTDHLVSGWKEDFMLSYKFPVLSQRRAIDYVNKHFLFRRKDIILGGHSKGGNLAMVAGMYANFMVRDRIVKIYNNDGPGLLLEQITSQQFLNIEDRLIQIVPNYSIVGLILRHNNQLVVVRSARKSILAHDLFTWVVVDKEFEKTSLSSFSKSLDNGLLHWLNQYDKAQREKFVVSLFDVFDRAQVYSLVDIMENKRLIFQLIMGTKEIDKDTRKILKDFVVMFLQTFKNVTKEEFASLFGKK